MNGKLVRDAAVTWYSADELVCIADRSAKADAKRIVKETSKVLRGVMNISLVVAKQWNCELLYSDKMVMESNCFT